MEGVVVGGVVEEAGVEAIGSGRARDGAVAEKIKSEPEMSRADKSLLGRSGKH